MPTLAGAADGDPEAAADAASEPAGDGEAPDDGLAPLDAAAVGRLALGAVVVPAHPAIAIPTTATIAAWVNRLPRVPRG